MHGEDIRHDTAINFEEAAVNTKETIEITRKEPCEVCHGEGIKPGTSKKTCPTCGGNGKVRQSSGFFSMVTTCPTCRGEGQVAESLCEACNGKKVKSKKRKIEVTIPAGVENGSYLKLSGEGNTGLNNGENGDLYVVINIRPHEIFEREGDDVILETAPDHSAGRARRGDRGSIHLWEPESRHTGGHAERRCHYIKRPGFPAPPLGQQGGYAYSGHNRGPESHQFKVERRA